MLDGATLLIALVPRSLQQNMYDDDAFNVFHFVRSVWPAAGSNVVSSLVQSLIVPSMARLSVRQAKREWLSEEREAHSPGNNEAAKRRAFAETQAVLPSAQPEVLRGTNASCKLYTCIFAFAILFL